MNKPGFIGDNYVEEYDEYDEDDDFNAGFGSDCGMGEDGQCQYAGTEECDECPFWDVDEEVKGKG